MGEIWAISMGLKEIKVLEENLKSVVKVIIAVLLDARIYRIRMRIAIRNEIIIKILNYSNLSKRISRIIYLNKLESKRVSIYLDI